MPPEPTSDLLKFWVPSFDSFACSQEDLPGPAGGIATIGNVEAL